MWEFRRDWFEQKAKPSDDGGYLLGEQACAVVADLQCAFCAGAWIAVARLNGGWFIVCGFNPNPYRETYRKSHYFEERAGIRVHGNIRAQETADLLCWLRSGTQLAGRRLRICLVILYRVIYMASFRRNT